MHCPFCLACVSCSFAPELTDREYRACADFSCHSEPQRESRILYSGALKDTATDLMYYFIDILGSGNQ